MRRVVRALVAAVVLAACLAPVAPANAATVLGSPTLPTSAAERERAASLAAADPQTRALVALRPGHHDVDVFRVHIGPDPRLVVRYRTHGHTFLVDILDDHARTVLERRGTGLTVMPGMSALGREQISRWYVWLPLLLAFGASLLARGPGSRSWNLGIAAPLATVSLAYGLTLANLVPARHILAGNIALDLLAMVPLLVIALVAARAIARAPARPTAAVATRPLLPTWLLGALAVAGAAAQGVLVATRDRVADVAYAGSAGGRLLRDGIAPYGHILDIRPFLYHADTYGPFTYLAYIPGLAVSDDSPTVGVATAVGAELVLVAAIAVLAWRARRAAGVAWALACLLTSPILLGTTAFGGNDTLPAATLALLLVAVRRPAWRGLLAGVAFGMKFLPGAVLFAVLRLRGERQRAIALTLLGATLATAVAALLALHGAHALHNFVERTIRWQGQRDDVNSLWAKLGIGPGGRLASDVLLALACVWVAARSAGGRLAAVHVPLASALLLVLAMFGLRQFWYSYVVWLLPLVVAVPLMAVEPAADDDL